MANSLERWLDNRRLAADPLDRLFNELVGMQGMQKTGTQSFSFSPSCEVCEEGNDYVMKFDIPGVPKDQVRVEVDHDQLTIRAERKEEKKQGEGKKFLSEISYGSYVRTFTLPGPVDEKKVNAKFADGVLTIRIPKTEASQTKQIQIH